MSYSLPSRLSRPCSPASPSRPLLSDQDLIDASDPFKSLMFPAMADSPSPLSTTSGNDTSTPTTTPSPTISYDALAAQFLNESADDNQFLSDYLNIPQDEPAVKVENHDISTNPCSLQGLQIRVHGVPNMGAKSRVETQIKLCVQLLSNGAKVSTWSHLRLSEDMLARSRLKRTQHQRLLDGVTMVSDESRILTLEAKIMCDSHPDKVVRMCVGCVRRERKRAERTKDGKRDSLSPSSSGSDMTLIAEEALERERDRILLFNCSPMIDFSSGDAILPTRITCYCRHHNERIGFRVQFSMKNDKGETLATGLSPPIMITDDHKSAKQQQQQQHQYQEQGQNRGNKRKRHPDSEIHTPDTPAPSRRGSVCKDTELYQASPLSTSSEELVAPLQFNDSLRMTPSSTAPAAITTSTTTTPTFPAPKESLTEAFQPAVLPHETSMMFADMDAHWPFNHRQRAFPVFATETAPQLNRLVPSQGPTYGGVEVTVLGAGFYRGLTCLFGEHAATTVYWNPNTLVCVLPPAMQPGPVAVSFKEHPLVLEGGQNVTLFTYIDSSDQALLELALQVVGLKMTGKLHDAKDIAMRIVQGGQDQTTTSSSGTQTQSNGKQCVEQQITEALCASDIIEIVHTNPSGHTMLHLASVLDYRNLAKALLSRMTVEAIDQLDRNGLSALHFACWRGSLPMVELLLSAGADQTLKGSWGTAIDIASSETIRVRLLAGRKPLSRRASLRRFHSLQDQHESTVPDSTLNMDIDGLGLVQPKLDRRLYIFWLPLLIVTIGLLYCQLLGENSTLLTLLQDAIPFRPRGLFKV